MDFQTFFQLPSFQIQNFQMPKPLAADEKCGMHRLQNGTILIVTGKRYLIQMIVLRDQHAKILRFYHIPRQRLGSSPIL